MRRRRMRVRKTSRSLNPGITAPCCRFASSCAISPCVVCRMRVSRLGRAHLEIHRRRAEGAALSEYIPLLKKELRDQGGLLLFDGLDEVPEAEQRREQIKQAIESFVSSFPRCRFLVTSRTYAYQKQDWKLHGFDRKQRSLPFTEGQITQFVDRWYAHIARFASRMKQMQKGKPNC